ncbi:MAG: hypothetical protein GXP45_02500 [bacterium]|nr:hypothetical protein [bacterium]
MKNFEKLCCESCGSSDLRKEGEYLVCNHCATKYSKRIEDIDDIELAKEQKKTISGNMSTLDVNNCIVRGNMNKVYGNYNDVYGNMNVLKGRGNTAQGNMNKIEKE